MFPLIKLLKVVLPVVTATTATIVTASLVSFKKEDLDKNKDKKDRLLDNFEIKVEEFKERTILYAEDGVENSINIENEDLRQKVLEELKKGKDLKELASLREDVPDVEKLQEFLSKVNDRIEDITKGRVDSKEVDEMHAQLQDEQELNSELSDSEDEVLESGLGENQTQAFESANSQEELTYKGGSDDVEKEDESEGSVEKLEKDRVDNISNPKVDEENLVLPEEKQKESELLDNDEQVMPNNKGPSEVQKDIKEETSESNSFQGQNEITQEELDKLVALKNQMLEFSNKLENLIV